MQNKNHVRCINSQEGLAKFNSNISKQNQQRVVIWGFGGEGFGGRTEEYVKFIDLFLFHDLQHWGVLSKTWPGSLVKVISEQKNVPNIENLVNDSVFTQKVRMPVGIRSAHHTNITSRKGSEKKQEEFPNISGFSVFFGEWLGFALSNYR